MNDKEIAENSEIDTTKIETKIEKSPTKSSDIITPKRVKGAIGI